MSRRRSVALVLVASCSSRVAAVPGRAAERAVTVRAEQGASVELAFVGDVIFGRYHSDGFQPICGRGCASPRALLADVEPLLRADLAVANLETPAVRSLPALAPIDTRKVFGATPAHVALLRDAGFGALSIANNHWFDQRFDGVSETPVIVREASMQPLGEAVSRAPWLRVVSVHRRGVLLSFIAFTAVLNKPLVAGRPMVPFVELGAVASRVGAVVRAQRRENPGAVVVVVAHWGVEYAREPTSEQTRAARALIDAGATLFIGHHPHVLQRIERYRAGLIAYSLGNFLFDNPSEEQRETGVLRARVGRDGVERATFVPVWIESEPMFHPTRAVGERAHKINRSLINLAEGRPPTERDAALHWEPR